MIRTSLFLLFMATGAAAECPTPLLGGGEYAATGAELITPTNLEVHARGEVALPCDDWRNIGVSPDQIDGFLPVRPTAIVDLEGMAPHILMVMAEAQCSPLLVVRTPDGLWHFGEQANGRQETTIWGAPDGPLQVWVGSEAEGQCDATLTLETFDR